MIDLPSTPPAGDSEYFDFIARQLADMRFMGYWLLVFLGVVVFLQVVSIFRRGR